VNLTVDIGNTLQKIGLHEKNELVGFFPVEQIGIEDLEQLYLIHQNIDASILSSVKDYETGIRDFLMDRGRFIEFSVDTLVPVINKYETPETLGNDRLAAVAAAAQMYPEKNCLVIQAGTCITFDLINHKKEYFGGAISPGIDMRLKALHNFTGKLPLIERGEESALIGHTTETSIISGVLNGIIEEVDGIIGRYHKKYPDLMVILSGGDMKYFDKRLKNNIFALPNIVLTGLNIILNYNFET